MTRTLGRLDRRLLTLSTRGRAPVTNRVMTSASGAANRSMIWMATAAALAAFGRRQQRTAAAGGLVGISIAATLVNGPLKFAWRRDRPPLGYHGGGEPLLPLPRTFSFPSGHAASAFAFATGASRGWPAATPVLVPAAATVAYSRVHTGVHYPSDVVVGATIGAASGLAGAAIVRRVRESSIQRVDDPALPIEVPRHAVLLTSEDSGSADGLGAARAAIEEAGWQIDKVFPVEDVDALAELLRTGGDLPLVIAAGGDGTVSAATNAIGDSGALLAIVPLGTSNDVARSLGIPPDPVEAACVVTDGRVCEVDLAVVRVDGKTRRFVNAATAGLNVEFARLATSSALRDRFGGLTYPVAAARALRGYEPFECTFECDGERRTVRAVHVSVSNAPIFGGVFGMRVPGASLTDGLLDVMVIERLSMARLVEGVGDKLVGRHKPIHGVHTMRVRSVMISAESSQEIALDGEVIGELPAEFEVAARALRVVVAK
jgi:undecaprenyl-diphosphatase